MTHKYPLGSPPTQDGIDPKSISLSKSKSKSPIEDNTGFELAELSANSNDVLEEIEAVLDQIPLDLSESHALVIGTVIKGLTDGSDPGLLVYDAWRAKKPTYRNREESKSIWAEIEVPEKYPPSLDMLRQFAQETGETAGLETHQQAQDTDKPEIEAQISSKPPVSFDRFSLRGKQAELKSEALEQVFILDGIALRGQSTLIYAPPNAGKTLIVLHLLKESIRKGIIAGPNVYFFNLDDNFSGIVEKLELSDQASFHMLVDGFAGFKISQFNDLVREICEKGQARQVIIILDTGKKVVDLMDKRRATAWGREMRKFIAKGGSLIILAHVNKHRDAHGKLVYAGTTDLLEDCDGAYVLDVVSNDPDTETRIVELECRKRRGNVLEKVAFSYSIKNDITYSELVASVQRIDLIDLKRVKQAEAQKTDAEIVSVVIQCITEGITSKMKLRNAVSDRSSISRRAAVDIIDRYSGDDPEKHRWNFSVREHGRKVYRILEGAGDE